MATPSSALRRLVKRPSLTFLVFCTVLLLHSVPLYLFCTLSKMGHQETFLTNELWGMVLICFPIGFPNSLGVGGGSREIDLAFPEKPPDVETNKKLPYEKFCTGLVSPCKALSDLRGEAGLRGPGGRGRQVGARA